MKYLYEILSFSSLGQPPSYILLEILLTYSVVKYSLSHVSQI